MTNNCGSCTLCCKVLGVQELKKPNGTWCTHCDKTKGCTIYENRPFTCGQFECIYLQWAEAGRALPLTLRPDKCKVVLWEADSTRGDHCIMAHVDPGHLTAWRDDPIYSLLLKMARKGYTVIVNGVTRHWQITVTGEREIEMTPNDENGVQHFVRYLDEPVKERAHED